ncbi:TetR/AcrR family transcriptional regulator C-terminal domain-containing protein [Actinoplanes sp. TRM 88003]|uniref:TetR/AcrR family transcriptional regulator C-terminal domain-containing protein n=1 Tax=Paractinoplanes aksuensis TaxID=2939490 RepID=A0ABT1DMM0_9ACTN|nr:TetR/AcrR family transcriptional regulator C-terminal domain-containing protein [Actinoplanes aksuensis]MCO8272072.1 TetR/AcrR family transcriptional regulator C-terminal domain-containing protein [Actinoplanes aksuensis]
MVTLGFTPAQALTTIMTVSDYTNSFVLQEQSVIGPPSEAEQAARPNLPTLLAALRDTGGYREPDEAYAHGLRVLVAGTEAVLKMGLVAGTEQVPATPFVKRNSGG